jgi:ADP-heptose:LPS heptosyltransferase
MLKRIYPGSHLTYFGGVRTQELWELEELIDEGIAFQGRPPYDSLRDATRQEPFDWVINLESTDPSCLLAAAISGPDTFVTGPIIDEEGRGRFPFQDDERGRLWQDQEWTAPDILARYSFLDSSFISTIFCRLCYLEGPVPGYRVTRCQPQVPDFDVIVSTAASLPQKLWPKENWFQVVDHLTGRNLKVAVVGAKPTNQSRYWQGGDTEESLVREREVADLRGKLSLPQVAGLISRSKQVVTIDNGILHVAASTETPVIGLFRDQISRLWTPPAPNVRALMPPAGQPVSDISVDQVLEALG